MGEIKPSMLDTWTDAVNVVKKDVPEELWYMTDKSPDELLYSETLIIKAIKVMRDKYNVPVLKVCEWWLNADSRVQINDAQSKIMKRIMELNK